MATVYVDPVCVKDSIDFFIEIVETKEWKAWKKGVPYTPQRRQTTQEEFKL